MKELVPDPKIRQRQRQKVHDFILGNASQDGLHHFILYFQLFFQLVLQYILLFPVDEIQLPPLASQDSVAETMDGAKKRLHRTFRGKPCLHLHSGSLGKGQYNDFSWRYFLLFQKQFQSFQHHSGFP